MLLQFLPRNVEGVSRLRQDLGISNSSVLSWTLQQIKFLHFPPPPLLSLWRKRWRTSYWKMGRLLPGTKYLKTNCRPKMNILERPKCRWLRNHLFKIVYLQRHFTALLKLNLISTSDGSLTISSSPLSTQTANRSEEFCIFSCTSISLRKSTLAHSPAHN